MLKARKAQTSGHPGLSLTLLVGGLPHFVPVSNSSVFGIIIQRAAVHACLR